MLKQTDQNTLQVVKVYTDRSAYNRQVGATAILTQPEKPTCTLHYHLETTEKHMIYETELVSLLLGLHLIKMERLETTSFIIGANNEVAVKVIQTELTHPEQYLTADFLHTATQIK